MCKGVKVKLTKVVNEDAMIKNVVPAEWSIKMVTKSVVKDENDSNEPKRYAHYEFKIEKAHLSL